MARTMRISRATSRERSATRARRRAKTPLAPANARTLIFRMRSSAVRRVFWLVFAFWFMPAIVAPEMVDHCPVHHAVAGGGSHHAAHAKTAPSNHSSHRGCTCLDRCCAASVASPSRADIKIAASVRPIANTMSIADDRIVVASVSLLLPPTTGPPPRG